MRPAPRPDAPGGSAAVVLVGLALALGGADEARAAPSVDHNRGSWFDSFLDPFGLAPVASGLTQDVVHDPIGARLLLAEGAQAGFFTTGAITPASFSTWGKLAVDRSVPSGTEVALWLYDPAADLLYGAEGARGTHGAPPPPLKLGAGADPSLREEATIAFVPTSVTSLRIYGRLSSNGRLQPAVNALRLTWTPRATLSLGAGAMPGEVPAGGTVVFEVRVAVSHVDASGLVVTLPLPTALANPRDQDQRLAFVSATDGGAPDASGAEIVWRLGQRKAGQTFSLRAVLRVPAGLLDGTVFQGEAFVLADNARKVGTPPWSFTVRSAPQLRVDRTLSDLYVIDGTSYAFSGSRHEARLWVENGGVANETLFDGLVIEDLRALLEPLASGEGALDPNTLVIGDGGRFAELDTPLPSGVVVPAGHLYWTLAPLLPGRAQSVSYAFALRGGSAIPDGSSFDLCATARSTYPEQADDPGAEAGACSSFGVPVPSDPSLAFALGEEVRGARGIGPGDDLAAVKAGFGEALTYLFHAANGAVSELDDVVVLGRVPRGTSFVNAYLPAQARGAVHVYLEPDGFGAAAPPAFDPETGALGAGWTSEIPGEPADVSWIAFRVPRLASRWFPREGAPTSALGEMTVRVDPPEAACPPEDVLAIAEAHAFVFGFVPQGAEAPSPITGGPLSAYEGEPTRIAPDLPSLPATFLAAPATLAPGGEVAVQLHVPNASAPGSGTPLDDALDLTARLAIPTVQANGQPTHLRVLAVDAPGAAITWELPGAVTLAWAQPLEPGASRDVTLRLAAPPGVLAGATAQLAADVRARDDLCGAVVAAPSAALAFAGAPVLQVAVDADLGYGDTGTAVGYRVRYLDPSLTPATGTWIVDKPGPGLRVTRIEVPAYGAVWFTSRAPGDGLPRTLGPAEPFDAALVRSRFTRLLDEDGDGFVAPPAGTAPTYIAWSVDDATLAPPQLVTQDARSLRIEGVITADEEGAIVTHQAAILSNELLQAVGTPAEFLVTPRPGLRVALACTDVAAAQEPVTLTLPFYNDSANPSRSTTLALTLPEGLSATAATVTWNAAYRAAHPGAPQPAIALGDGVTVQLGGLGPLEGGTLEVSARIDYYVPSGTFLTAEVLGTARADAGTAVAYDGCTTLIENAELEVRLLADNPAPRAGETVGFTLLLANLGAHDAHALRIDATLPSGLGYVAGSALVTPFPWTLAPSAEPAVNGGSLSWSAPVQALTGAAGEPAVLPGGSGEVALRFQARVADTVLPGTPFEVCGGAETETTDDGRFPNATCLTVTTPLPDPFVTLSAPDVRAIDARSTWTVRYGNLANEVAAGVVVFFSLPDGPSPPADGAVDLTWTGQVTPADEVVWYHHGPAGPTPPPFDRLDPRAGGWVARPTPGAPVSHLAMVVGRLEPYASPRSAEIALTISDPDGRAIAPGSAFTGYASVAMRPGLRDQVSGNNADDATVRVPGIDLALHARCTPSGAYPGLLPGERFEATFALENSGVERAHGLGIDLTLPAGASLVGGPGPTVEVVDADGQPAAAIDALGRRLTSAVPWTRDGQRLVMGSLDPQSPLFYRRVGLAAGDRALARVSIAIADDVANRTPIDATGRVRVDYVEGFEPEVNQAEAITDNNRAACGVSVLRADVHAHKSVVNRTTGSRTIADQGDLLGWTIGYDNAGDHEASDVVIEDAVPEGLAVIVGGVTNVDPGAVDIAYSNDGGASFAYTPKVPVGTPDASITHVRIAWRSDMPAPAGGLFIQTTAADFARGTHDGTRADARSQGVIPEGTNRCLNATCEPVDCALGSYVPEGGCCPVCRPSIDGCANAPVAIEECSAYIPAGNPSWTGCYDLELCEGGCNYPMADLGGDDSFGAVSRMRVERGYGEDAYNWMSCVREGGGSGCDRFRCFEGAACDPATPLWEQTWIAACPGAPMYSCQQGAWVDTCYAATGVALRTWVDCLGLGLGERCEWLRPSDDCGACLTAGCEATPDELRVWGNVPWWVRDYFKEPVRSFLATVVDLRLTRDAPDDFVPTVPLEACAVPKACGDASPPAAAECAVPCDPSEFLCQICDNGATCQTCLGGGEIGIGQPDAADECTLVAAMWSEARERCAADATELVRSSGLPEDEQRALLDKLLANCDGYEVPDCDAPASCTGSRYTSPAFPGPDEGRVISWRRAIVEDASATPEAIRYSVLDARTGEALPGLAGIESPEDGVIDLAHVSPAEHPTLELQVDFLGGGGSFLPIENPKPEFDECVMNGQLYIEPWHIDESGRVTGIYYACSYYLFTYTRAEGLRVLPAHPHLADAAALEPWGVSEDGRIAATWRDAEWNPHALFWDPTSGWTDLEEEVRKSHPKMQVIASAAADVNSAGEVIGVVHGVLDAPDPDDPGAFDGRRPFMWSPLTGLVTLDRPIENVADAWGMRINEAGQVAGTAGYSQESTEPLPISGTIDRRLRAYTWVPASGEARDIFLPTGVVYPSIISLNEAGRFIVQGYADASWRRTWYWDGGALLVLHPVDPKDDPNAPLIGLGYSVEGYDLDARGRVVGSYRASQSANTTQGFVWTPGAGMALVPGSGEAYAIAADGTVLAGTYGVSATSWTSQLFLWKAGRRSELDIPASFSEAWPHWYAWDGFQVMNDNLQLTGHVYPADGGADIAYTWEPRSAEELGLLEWRVDYRTDRNPWLGLDTEVGRACADTVDNRVSIATSTPQVGTDNDRAAASIAINRADLEVTLTAEPAAARPGDRVTWTVSWLNRGPGAARGVDVTLRGPADVLLGGEEALLDGAELAPGEGGAETFETWMPDRADGDSVALTAAVATTTLDCDADDDADSAAVVIGTYANAWVALESPAAATLGEAFEVGLAYGNSGNAWAGEGVVRVEIPAGLELESATGAFTSDGGTLSWPLPDGLEPGAAYTQTLRVVARECGLDRVRMGWSAAIEVDALDVDASDERAGAETLVVAPAGRLALALVPGRADARPGEVVSWTMHLANPGDATVFEPRVEVDLAGLTPVGPLAEGLARDGDTLVWTRARLGPNEAGATLFEVTAPAGEALSLSAVASGRGTCPSEAHGEVAVAPRGVHLAIAADAASYCPEGDAPLGWMVTVVNDGEVIEEGVRVGVSPGAGMAFVADRFRGRGGESQGDEAYAWTIEALAPGAALSFGFATRPEDPSRVETPALLQGATLTAGARALSATAAVANRCRPALAVRQEWDAACAVTGGTGTLTVVVSNPTASTLEGVTLSERLPEPLTFVSAPGATWDPATRRVTAPIGQLRPGAERRVGIALGVPAAATPGTLYATEALVTAREAMPQVSNRLIGGALACDDGNACTHDACTPLDGCVSAAAVNGTGCDDGDACTSGDVCEDGACGGAAATCDDGNPCTVDTCDPARGCTHDALADGARCDDGDRCSTNDLCRAGVCEAGPAVVCGAPAACREAGVCDPATGACAFATSPDGTPCQRDDACAGQGRCEIGACVTGNPLPGECRCGDTWIITGEQCDDGNAQSGDGCSASCAVEAGWRCFGLEPDAGEANPGGVCTRLCGNAVSDPDEQCDDGNLTEGDGCDRDCRVEPGYVCAEPGARCTTRCGDGVFVSPEHCDDGNASAGDGCSATCQVETGWECLDPERCRPVCGDGVLVGGQRCDDGNARAGDGCSASCVVEPGWSCPTPGVACVSETRLTLVDDRADTLEDTPVEIAVIDNDVGREVRATAVTDPAHGAVELVDAFTVRYRPAPGFSGEDAFRYRAVDRDGATAEASVTVNVAPLADEDFDVARVDQSCSGTGATYQVDVALVGGSGKYLLDGEPVTAVFRTVEPSGKTAGYLIEDASASPTLAAKNITGQLTCERPPKTLVAHPDAITTVAGVGSVDVLANDVGSGLELVSIDAPAYGTATFDGGVVRYVAKQGFAGQERLLYRVADADGAEDAGELVVTVPPGAFDARDDRAATTRGQAVTIDIGANDLGTASLAALGEPAHGSVRRTAAGVVTYTPAASFVGEDSFTYTLSAGGTSDTAVVRVSVVESGACLAIAVDELVPTCESAQPDAAYKVALDLSGGSGVYTVDGGSEGLTLHTAADTDTRMASRTLAPPPPEVDATYLSKAIASDTSIRLNVRDAMSPASCPVKTVSTKVDCGGGTPVEAVDDVTETRAMIAVLVRPLANDRGVGLSTSSIGRPEHGALEALELGVYRYTPAPGFTGTERITYAVRDAYGAIDGGVVEIRVLAHDPAVCDGFGAEALTPTCSADLTTVTWRFAIARGSGLFRVRDAATDRREVVHTSASGAALALRVEDLAAPECGAFTVIGRHTCAAPPSAPAAVPDQVSLEPGATAVFDPLANDLGHGLVVTAVGRPASGTIAALRDGGWLYAPRVGFSGVDTASYTIADGAGRTASGRITFYVNDPTALVAGCQTCALAAIDDRLALAIGERQSRDVLANDLGSETKLVDYQGFSRNDVRVAGSTFTVTGVHAARGERITYRVRDGRGHVDEGVLLLSVSAGAACEAVAGTLLRAPPAACGATFEAVGHQGATGYAQGFVVTDLLDRVVAFEGGATLTASLPPGDYRVRAFNWRTAASEALPIVGEPLALTGCQAASPPVRYTELAPIAIETETSCSGGGYQMDLTTAGGEPELGLGSYLTELSAIPPYRAGQVVIVTVSDEAGCATTRAVTMPDATCGGTR